MSTTQTDAEFMMGLAMSFPLLKCLNVAAELNLADLIGDSPSKSVDELAKATSTKVDLLYRVMRNLAANGIFVELENHSFSNSPRSQFLRSNVKGSLKDTIHIQLGGEHSGSINGLNEQVKTGELSCIKVFGSPVWDLYGGKFKERGFVFNNVMRSLSEQFVPMVIGSYDFAPFKMIADVGGGHGHLLEAILNRAPSAKGVVFDLPFVIEQSKQSLSSPILKERATFESGDFFKTVPADCDLYVMKWIIHDWDDEHCVTILKNIRKVIPKNGKMLIFDSVLAPPNQGPFSKSIDIIMMTVASGKERTEVEFKELVAKAGFKVNDIFARGLPFSIVECVPVDQ